MNWSDEIYVRVYTRDTITWKLLGWEGRTVLVMLMRKVDRAGSLELEAGVEGLSALLELPEDITERGLASCIKRGSVINEGARLLIPKFLEAQTALKSEAQRAREYRARKAEQPADVGTPDAQSVTKSDASSREAHSPARKVTTVTNRHSLLCSALPCFADPPKSPTGDLPGLKIDKPLPPGFWQRFVARAGKEWGLPERFVTSCEAIGAIVPGREQAQLLAGALEAQQAGYSEQDFMKLADFIAAGGVGWRGAAWQHVSKNFVAELSKALAWDGVSDPRQRTPTAKAPPQLPQSPQPQRVYAETTAKRQADAIERGELPEVDPAIVAAELRKMQEATS